MHKKFELNRTKIKGAVSREVRGGQVYTYLLGQNRAKIGKRNF